MHTRPMCAGPLGSTITVSQPQTSDNSDSLPSPESPNSDSLAESTQPVAVSAAHWTESIAQSLKCPSCGADQADAYCPTCGQRQLGERVRFGAMARDLVEKVTNIEKGYWFTVLSLFRRPGRVPRDYVAGKQNCYVNPLTYFLIGTALQIVALWFTQDILREQLVTQFESSKPSAAQEAQFEQLEGKLGKPMGEALAESYFLSVQQAYAYAALLFFCVPFALLLYWFHTLLGEPFRLGETIVFSLYIMGQMLLITAVLTPFCTRIGTSVQMVMALITYIGIPQWAHGDFFQSTWPSRLLTLVATGISMLIFVASIMCIFLVTFVVTVMLAVLG